MRSRWAVPVPLQPNELFSSWLVRAALTQGCDPLVLTGEVWGKWRIWTTDVDRIYASDTFQTIAHLSGNTIENFRQNSLYVLAAKIICGEPSENAIWPWVLALGTRNTKRRGGLQYCPQCLAADTKPYYRKQWRLAWHTACEIHQSALLDRCHVCRSPVEPHRLLAQDRHINHCATCKSDLSLAPSKIILMEVISFQRIADEVIRNGHGEFQSQKVDVVNWFKLLDFFVSMVRRANRSQTVVLHEFLSRLTSALPINLPVITGAGIELLMTSERQKIFISLYQIMMFSKVEFERIALEVKITRQAFCSKDDELPEVLKPLYELLPENSKVRSRPTKRKRHQPRPRHEVIKMMQKLERKLEMIQR